VTDALEVEYRIDETTKRGIAATTVDVLLTGEEESDGDGRDHDHHHDTDHHHDQGDSGHEHDHDGTRAEGHGPHRSYLEVRGIVAEMDLEPPVERDALAIFGLLGEAEASVHGEALEEIHFHEVGADDAIADVVGATALLHDLEPERVVTTPCDRRRDGFDESRRVPRADAGSGRNRRTGRLVATLRGSGRRRVAHAHRRGDSGAVADGIDALPALELEASGYGAGGYDLDPHPNVLRILVGDGAGQGELAKDDIAVLETNLDDATPEVLGGLQETLADAGARDVSILPATMKKSRPGHLVKVICKPADRARRARALAEETGTLGVRDAGVTHRWIANREFETVTLEIDGDEYEVTVKIASDSDGEVYDVSAEYDDDAMAVAREIGVPIRKIRRQAESAFEESFVSDRA